MGPWAESVTPNAVTVTVAVAVSPSAEVAVTVAVQRPAAYVCSAVWPSATVPSPRSQWYAVAAPTAVSTTFSGAGPDAGEASMVTAGGAPAAAGTAITKAKAQTRP